MTERFMTRRLGGLALTLALVGVIAPSEVSGQGPLTELTRRAEQGDALSHYNLGFSYAYGTGVAQDDALALAWYRKAAVQGLATAQLHAGVMYAQGEGTTQDFTEAVMWLRRAAHQNDSTARYHLREMYTKGQGVPGDEAEALVWFHEAANEGEVPAQYALGVMYADGADSPPPAARRPSGAARGIPTRGRRLANKVEAHRWFSVAASRVSGEEQRFYADIRDRVGRELGADQLAEAQGLAREWQADFELRQAE
jgi:TPR repeat protein